MATRPKRKSQKKARHKGETPAIGLKAIPAVNPRIIFAIGFGALTVALLFLIARLLSPFLTALIWAAVLAILVSPIESFLLRLCKGKKNISALITTVLVMAAMAGPGWFLLNNVTKQSISAYESLQGAVGAGGLAALSHRLKEDEFGTVLQSLGLDEETALKVDDAVREFGGRALKSVATMLTEAAGIAAQNIVTFGFKIFVIMISLYYFLREGGAWLRWTRQTVPLAPEVWDLVMSRFSSTVTAVLHGLFLVALAQGIVVGLGFKFFHVPFPILFGFVGFFFALLPMLGTLIVWIPAVLWLYAQGDSANALYLLIYCGILISILDYAVKPMVIGEKAKLPTLFLLLSTLGGIHSYGPLGLFLGPVLLAIGIAVAGVYRELASRAH